MIDQYGLGIRVPGLVISPYARQGYIDHKTYSFESWLKIVEERFGITPMQARDNNALDMIDSFDFSQQPRDPVVLMTSGSPYPPALQTIVHPANTVSSVLAPTGSGSLAAEAIASGYGTNLATSTQGATTLPLPLSLAGTTVKVRDSAGAERPAQLFYVSPNQVNYMVPSGTASGTATITIFNANGVASTGTVQIVSVAPGLFTANQTGQGAAAANAVVMHADGSQSVQAVAQCDSSGLKCVPSPIDLGSSTDQVFLVLYGTGNPESQRLVQGVGHHRTVGAECELCGTPTPIRRSRSDQCANTIGPPRIRPTSNRPHSRRPNRQPSPNRPQVKNNMVTGYPFTAF